MDPDVLERLLAVHRRELAHLYDESIVGPTWAVALHISDALDCLDNAAMKCERVIRKDAPA